MIGRRTLSLLIIGILMSGTGCHLTMEGAVEEEIRSLMRSPWSATGSDFQLALCGWPAARRLELKSLSLNISPMSDRKFGSGTAEAAAEGEGVTCRGKVFFTYSRVYMGGHGAGGSELRLGTLKRESPVEAFLANPPAARPLKVGQLFKGALTPSSFRLPDGCRAEYFRLSLPMPDPPLKMICISENKGFNPKGYIYQQGKLVGPFSYFGNRLRTGEAILMVTGGSRLGPFSLKVDLLEGEEGSRLRY